MKHNICSLALQLLIVESLTTIPVANKIGIYIHEETLCRKEKRKTNLKMDKPKLQFATLQVALWGECTSI